MTFSASGKAQRVRPVPSVRLLATILAFLVVAILGWSRPAAAAPYAYVPSSTTGTISVIDVATNTVTATIPGTGTNPGGTVIDPAGAFVYHADLDLSVIQVIATATNTIVGSIPINLLPVAVALNPAGTRLYVTNRLNRTFDVVDTATRTVVGSVPLGGTANPWTVAVNPAGTRAYVVDTGTSPTTGKLHVVDLTSNTLVTTVALTVGATPYDVVIDPAGTRVYVVHEFIGISIIDTATNAVVGTMGTGFQARYMSLNPAGTRAYVANFGAGALAVYDLTTNTLITMVPTGAATISAAVEPTGAFAYAISLGTGTVAVIDTATNAVVATIPVGPQPVTFGQFIGGAAAAPPDTTPPTAVLDGPSTVALGSAAGLSGARSSDVGGTVASYQWSAVARPPGAAALASPETTATPSFSFTPDVAGRWELQLVVRDDSGNASQPAARSLMVIAPDTTAPTAVLDGPSTVALGSAVALSGARSADVGGTVASYRWSTVARPAGASAFASPVTTTASSFGFTPDAAGVWTVQLVVTDDSGNASSPALLSVVVRDAAAPTAVLDGPSTGAVGGAIALSGARSSDVGGTVASYQWSALSRPARALALASPVTTTAPSFSFTPDAVGLWTVQLVVTDSSGNASAPAIRSVAVVAPDTTAPTAVIEGPATGAVGVAVTLSGARSADVGGTVASYLWSAPLRPPGATAFASPSTATSSSFSFTPDVAGRWVVQLVVRDSSGNASAPAMLSIIVVAPDTQAPTAVLDGPATGIVGVPAVLSGSRSVDAGGSVASYEWSAPLRPAGALALASPVTTTASSFTFTPDAAGRWVVQLVVRDSSGNASAPATHSIVVVTPDTDVPTAVLDGPSTVLAGNAIGLSGARSFDVGGAVASYQWSVMSRPARAQALPAVVTTTVPSFSFTPDMAGRWVVQLVVRDNAGNASAPTTLSVMVVAPDTTAPTAVLDGPTAAVAGGAVPLSGARSVDVGGTVASYQWSAQLRPARAFAFSSPVTTVTPSFSFTPDRAGTWVVQLVVRDGAGNASAPALLTVNVAFAGTAAIGAESGTTVWGASPGGEGTIMATLAGGGAGCAFARARFTRVEDAARPPAGVAFPLGVADLALSGCTPGGAVTVFVTYPVELPAGVSYYAFGRAPGDAVPQWRELPTTIKGNAVSFTLVDGGAGDGDGAGEGLLSSLGGPGTP